MGEKLLLIGGGGHCRSVIDSIDKSIYTDIAIVDISEKVGERVLGIEIIGTDDDLQSYFDKGYKNAFITIGSIKASQKRKLCFDLIKDIGFSLPVIIDKTATVSDKETTVSEGTFIGKGAIINAGSKIGVCCIVNSGAVIDHDCTIGDFSHIAPGVSLSGEITVGNCVHIGTGSSVIQCINIGDDVTVGAGSVVVSDIEDDVTAFGNPCRVRAKVEST